MHDTQQTVGSIAIALGLVLLVLGGAVSPAFATAPIVDTETTDTSTESDIVDGTTIDNFEANSSNESSLEADFDSDNPKVTLRDPEVEEQIDSWGNSSFEYTNQTDRHFRKNFSHDEFGTVPMEPGENKSVTLRLFNDSTADNPDTTNVTLNLNNSEKRSVIRVGETVASSDDWSYKPGDAETVFGVSVPGSSVWEDENGVFKRESVAVGGADSTLTVAVPNETAESAFDNQASGVSSEEWAKGIVVQVASTDEEVVKPVKVYVDSAPDDVDNSTTYGVYDSGANTVTVPFVFS